MYRNQPVTILSCLVVSLRRLFVFIPTWKLIICLSSISDLNICLLFSLENNYIEDGITRCLVSSQKPCKLLNNNYLNFYLV